MYMNFIRNTHKNLRSKTEIVIGDQKSRPNYISAYMKPTLNIKTHAHADEK